MPRLRSPFPIIMLRYVYKTLPLPVSKAGLHHAFLILCNVQVLWDLADIDARTAGLLARILQPFLSIGILLMIIRIVLSWYPQVISPPRLTIGNSCIDTLMPSVEGSREQCGVLGTMLI